MSLPDSPRPSSSSSPSEESLGQMRLSLEELRNEVKARETNRVRATYTLVSETLDALRGERPVTSGAIKGFITAFLVPRLALVVGSAVGGVFLAIQTWAIVTQTAFVKQQADAAEVDRADKLRQRILKVQTLDEPFNVLVNDARKSPSKHPGGTGNAVKDALAIVRGIRDMSQWPLGVMYSRAPDFSALKPRTASNQLLNDAYVYCLASESATEEVRAGLLVARVLIDTAPMPEMELMTAVSMFKFYAESGQAGIGKDGSAVVDAKEQAPEQVRRLAETFAKRLAKNVADIQESCASALKRDLNALRAIEGRPASAR